MRGSQRHERHVMLISHPIFSIGKIADGARRHDADVNEIFS